MLATQLSVDDLVSCIPDGAKIALPPDYSYCAMAAVRALIRRGARELHIVGVPTRDGCLRFNARTDERWLSQG